MKRIALFLVCIAVAMSGGCAPKPQALTLTRVNIAFQEWVGYGPLYLAQENGFCKEEGIECVYIDEQLDSARREAFNQGMLDAEAGTLDLLVSKVGLGMPLIAVMEIDQSNGADAIVAAEDIKNMEDLEGKRIALARDNVGETFLSDVLYKNRVSFKNVLIKPQSSEKVAQAFLKGEVDACVTWEPQVSAALQRPGAHILASTKEYPGVIIDTLNVRKDLVEKNPELVKKIMRALFKAIRFCRDRPIEASEIISKHYKMTPIQYRKQIEGLTWEGYDKWNILPEYREWLEAFDAVVRVKLANGRISQKPDAAKSINYALLEKLYENIQ